MQAVLFVDSRARTDGSSDSSFAIELRESLHLNDHGVRVDNLRLTNSFLTSDPGKYIYYKNGSGGIQYYALPEQAYTGSVLAAALQTATGRTTAYSDVTNSITQSITAGQEWLSDAELKSYAAGVFPSGASATAPLALNAVLGDATINNATGNLQWTFVKMAPYDYLFLRSRRLTVENSHDPFGRHDVLATIPLVNGIGSVETSQTPDGVYLKLPRDLTLRSIDFELTDYRGNPVNLRGRPLSFELCFD